MDWENYKTEYEKSYRYYQHEFNEILMSPDANFWDIYKDSVVVTLSPELNDLRAQLMDEIIALFDTLTEIQKKYIKAYFFENLTQTEIARRNNCNQTNVHKAIFGNFSKKTKDGEYMQAGGAIRRLKKQAAKSEKIQNLLKKIAQLESQEII